MILTACTATALVAAPAVADPIPADPNPGRGPSAPGGERLKPVRSGDRLGQHDRQLLLRAQRRGDKQVTLLMATDRGQTATSAVAAGARRAGGVVGAVNPKLGYVRARVPITTVDAVTRQKAVVAVDLNELIPLQPREQTAATAATTTAPGPNAQTADSNPYLPTVDTGATLFKAAQPTWDGRGTTVGILDSGVDLDHPALATTSTGERKIVDWVTATDPQYDADPTWLKMDTAVTADPTFSSDGTTWTAPASGSYRFRVLPESSLVGDLGGDLNRDGDTTDRFGVLYDETTNDIWVDNDQSRSFTAAERMRPYAEGFQVGHFGTDNPATPAVRETVPFTVEFRRDVSGTTDYVNIGLVADEHGTHVAGIAAGSKLFGGKMNGQAPGAKLISERACLFNGCTSYALLEGMIDLIENRHVDVVNMSIGGLPALNDGNNARAELYNRLIAENNVQIFISAGNSGPGVNTVGDPAVATDAVAVASEISKATWQANYGSTVQSAVNLHTFSSRGPREDGGLKPNLAAPGSAISTVPLWLPVGAVPEAGYTLPVGYGHLNGTSMSSPQAAGGAALLLSAAKAKGITVTARGLRDALYTAAVPLPGVSTSGQGGGLISVPLAWVVLSQAKADGSGARVAPVGRDYQVTAPVCTALSGFLRTPGSGTGVYNRCTPAAGGQQLGVAKTYAISILRTSGDLTAVKHNLRLVGDDGKVFSVPKTLAIAKNTPTSLSVVATTKAQGVAAAILEVDDPATPVVDLRIPLTVLQSATAQNSASSLAGPVQRNLAKSLFVSVPTGTSALNLTLGGLATGSQTRFTVIDPQGIPRDPAGTLQCYANFSDPAVCNPNERTYANPLPGIWEIAVEARRTSPQLDNPFQLTASLQSVVISPAVTTLPTASTGTPVPLSWTATNAGAAITVTPRGGALASARVTRPTIAEGEQQQYPLTVTPGSTSLEARIGGPSDPGADLDLALYRCTNSCVLVASSATGSSEEVVRIANPAAGTYLVLVDAYAVPAGTTQFDYLDAFVNPGLGSLNVPTVPITLAAGASTPLAGDLVATQAPAAGRQLRGTLEVTNPAGGVVGSAQVFVQSVS